LNESKIIFTYNSNRIMYFGTRTTPMSVIKQHQQQRFQCKIIGLKITLIKMSY